MGKNVKDLSFQKIPKNYLFQNVSIFNFQNSCNFEKNPEKVSNISQKLKKGGKHGQKSIFSEKITFFQNLVICYLPKFLQFQLFVKKSPKKVSKINQKLKECALCLFGKKRPKISFAKFDHFYLLKCGKKLSNVSRK